MVMKLERTISWTKMFVNVGIEIRNENSCGLKKLKLKSQNVKNWKLELKKLKLKLKNQTFQNSKWKLKLEMVMEERCYERKYLVSKSGKNYFLLSTLTCKRNRTKWILNEEWMHQLFVRCRLQLMYLDFYFFRI